MNTITLKSKQTTDTLYNYINRMVVDTLNNEDKFDEAYDVSKVNVIRNKGFYLVQFEAKGQEFEVKYTTDQIQSYVLEQLQRDIHSASMSTGWRD